MKTTVGLGIAILLGWGTQAFAGAVNEEGIWIPDAFDKRYLFVSRQLARVEASAKECLLSGQGAEFGTEQCSRFRCQYSQVSGSLQWLSEEGVWNRIEGQIGASSAHILRRCVEYIQDIAERVVPETRALAL